MNRSSRRKALHHLGRLGRHRHRVAVVDDERFDLRPEGGRARVRSRSSPMVTMLMVRGVRPASRSGRVQGHAVDREHARGSRAASPPAGAATRPPAPAGRPRPAPRCRRRARAACRSSGGSRPASWCRSRAPDRRSAAPAHRRPRPRVRVATARPAPAGLPSPACAARCSRGPASRGTISWCISASASAASVPGAGRCAHGICRRSRCGAGRCTPGARHCAWPAARGARSAGCWRWSCCPR